MILSLCITSLITFRADAQQNTPRENPNRAKIQQLRQDMQALRQQLEPLRSQMQQLMAQVRALREQMRPIQEKLKADREQMRALRGEHGQYHAQGLQGQGQHPSGPTTNSEQN
jgi:peptidoglycan hydrolase CwlO-like protein